MKKTISILICILAFPSSFVFAQDAESVFAKIDLDKNGVLSKSEFAAYIELESLVLPATLIQSISDAADALAKDDFATYQKHLPVVIASVKRTSGAVRATLAPLAERLGTGKDIKSARRTFEPFSNAVANFVLAQPATNRQAKVFQCPMSPVLGVGRWIQKDNAELLNPFFGAEMLHCGKELK
ncbi:MAG: EF-hand domain-containing protein [Planctomycetaceae bacterium]|jgi:Cu(I)/Ag(I) efflux system membrane fusion protein|nr:EF-hand domain-containing protein [Planctomycetaceae bacterium]